MISTALSIEPNEFAALFHRAVLRRDGFVEATEEDVERDLPKVIHLQPRFAPAYEALAWLLARDDARLADAVAMMYVASELMPDNPRYRIDLAELANRQGKRGQATKIASQAVSLSLQTSRAYVANTTCWFGSLQGFAELVSPTCQRAVTLNPENVAYRDSRGLNRALNGDLEGAVEDFEFALESNDMDEEFRSTRGTWIQSFSKGKNPIDGETLTRLLGRKKSGEEQS